MAQSKIKTVFFVLDFVVHFVVIPHDLATPVQKQRVQTSLAIDT